MITNIVDRRENSYKWSSLWGVVEPTCHDNSIPGADTSPSEQVGFVDYTSEPKTLSELLEWANSINGNMTLFIYNENPM